jgi:hypothetical protein
VAVRLSSRYAPKGVPLPTPSPELLRTGQRMPHLAPLEVYLPELGMDLRRWIALEVCTCLSGEDLTRPLESQRRVTLAPG